MQEYNVNTKKIGLGIVLASLTWLVLPVANAQSDADVIESVRACQSITGLSARLACYDQVLPPGTQITGTVRTTETIDSDDSMDSREQELEVTVADLEQQLELETLDSVPTARIIEVSRPDLRSSRLVAADGRVFVESNTTTIVRWPETPFDVEVNRSLTGTITIRAIGVDRDRGQGRGVRVALER